MAENRSIILSRDGSHTLFHPELNETYHSRNGALRESIYVYIDKGFSLYRELPEVHVIEVGFGTGLNALLTWNAAEEYRQCVHYHTLEPFPLPEDLFSQLNYPSLMSNPAAEERFRQLHQAVWEEEVKLSEYFTLHKYNTTLENAALPPDTYHLCYYDAFAPSRQTEIWSEGNLAKIFRSLNEEGVLVTYCAQGQFKRTLKAVGFRVEKLKGPPFKEEMIRGWKKSIET